MTKRQDLRPAAPADSLKRLVRASTNKDTRPHGRKVIGGGSLELYDPAGNVEVRIAPGESVFTGRIIVQGDSSVPMGSIDGLLKPGTTVIDGGNIDADTMGARLMEAGTLRVTHPDGARVEVTGAGYKAWNAAGSQTVNLDGSNNYMTGSFQTAPAGQRVRIRNADSIAAVDLFASTSTDDHVGIWYQSPDGNVLNAVGRVAAMTGSTFDGRTSPGLELYPMRGTFRFTGRWQQDSDTVKFCEVVNTAGLGPGAYTSVWIPYQSPFPTSNAMYFPMVTADTTEGVELVATVNGQDSTGLRVQLNNKSTTKATGRIIVRVVSFCANA